MSNTSKIWKSVTQFALTLVAALAFAGTASSQTITYIHTDHLGSPIVTTDPVGNVTWSATRSAFGDVESTTGQSTHAPVGYTGAAKDTATGFIYLQNRFYDPTVARFISVDSERFEPESPMSFNRYDYANNNPYRYIDPDGRIPVDTVADVGFVLWDTGALIWDEVFHGGENRAINLAALGADTAGIFIPYATGFGLATRAGRAATATGKIIGKGGLKGFAHAGEYGIQSYNTLVKLKKNLGTGLQAHHLVERRFAKVLGVNQGDMLAINLLPKEHEPFTRAWIALIPKGAGTANATKEQIMDAARQIYKEYPEILKALGL